MVATLGSAWTEYPDDRRTRSIGGPGATVAVDLHLPSSDVEIQAARFNRFGKQIGVMIALQHERDDHAGRRWTVTIPAAARRSTDMLISAHFARGDIFADVGLRRS